MRKEKPPKAIPPYLDPPEHLDEDARAKWARLTEVIEFPISEYDSLAAYCCACSRWAKAEEELKKTGPVVKSPSGFPIQNPWLSISNHAADEIRRWGKILRIV